MKKRTLRLLISLFIFVMFISPRNLLSAPYYEGKVIKIIIGSNPGGGDDRIARLLAKHLPKHIPGKPRIIVENMIGGGGFISANYIYNIAKPDGLTITSMQRGNLFAQLINAEGVKFDIVKYSWIGSAAIETTILCIRSDLPYKTFNDLLKTKDQIFLACAGAGATDAQYPELLKAFLSLNFKMVTYTSSSESMLAIERKEGDGKAGSYSSLKPYIERGLLRPLIRGRVPQRGIENLPVDEDFIVNKKGKALMAMLSTGDRIGRPYVAPPGTSLDVMNILRDAFAKVPKDSELKEEAQKSRIEVEYVPADECLKVLNDLFGQPDDVITEFRKYIKF